MRARRVLLTLALAALYAWPVLAQPTPAEIAGTVKDERGLPVAGASITLTGTAGAPVTATSDDQGRFRIAPVAAGRYQLTVKGTGFREWTQDVTPKGADVYEVSVVLQLPFTETVIVTASRGEQTLLTAPAAVSVVATQQIEASPAESVPELLRGVPGLNMTQFGARDVEINARSSTGILANSMLVMVDGRSVVQPLYGAVYWDLMSTTKHEISQIEVMRSPASAVWGANALNGVINLRMKSPREMQGLRGEASVGERGTRAISASWADANDRFSYKLSGSYYEQDAWERDNTLPDGSPMPPQVLFQNRGTEQPKFDGRVDLGDDPSRFWSVRGGIAGANGLIHSALGPAEFDSGSYYSYIELARVSEDLDFKVYWNRLDSPFNIVLYNLPQLSTDDTYAADLTKRVALGDHHRLTFGGSVKWDRFDITIAPNGNNRVDGAAFIEDNVKVSSLVSFTAGGRVDKFDTTNAVFAPRLSLLLTPKRDHSVRVAYNRAYRAPSLLENFLDVTLPAAIPGVPNYIYPQVSVGEPDLEMEKQDAFEVGYMASIGSHAVVSATVYTQQIANGIWFLPVGFYSPLSPPPAWPFDPALVPLLPSTFTFMNVGKIRDKGIELAGQLEWPQFSINGSYTFQADPKLDSELPLQINQPASNQGGVTVTYRRQPWAATGEFYFTGRAFWADVFTQPFWGFTDAYSSINARLSYRPRKWPGEIWLSATDLFDEKIQSHVFGDIIRRKVTAGVRWELPR